MAEVLSSEILAIYKDPIANPDGRQVLLRVSKAGEKPGFVTTSVNETINSLRALELRSQ